MTKWLNWRNAQQDWEKSNLAFGQRKRFCATAHILKNFRCIVSPTWLTCFGSWIGCNGGRDVPSIELRKRIK